MDNFHFIPNNILTEFCKELTKFKNDYQLVFKLYIYIQELYYMFNCISLSISIHIHEVTSQFILIRKVQRKFNQNLKLKPNFAPCV